MPYTQDDPKLPSNVKKLPAKKRRQWVAIWNGVVKRGGSESSAFAQANGAVKEMTLIPIQCECKHFTEVESGTKEHTCPDCARIISISWREKELADGEKCDMPYDVTYSAPYGGAVTFDDVDNYFRGVERNDQISTLKYTFDALFQNIWNQEGEDVTTDQKIAQTEAAAADLVTRMQRPPERTMGVREKVGELVSNVVNKITGNTAEASLLIPPIPQDAAIWFTKQKDGRYRWLALFSNKFKDREREIFSEAAHKDYERWVDANKAYPVLRYWHVPGTDFGKADLVTYADGFQLSSGFVYKGFEHVAESLADVDLAVSHGYLYDDKDFVDGVYNRYRTFEISVLPRGKESNIVTWAAFNQVKQEVAMGLTKEKRLGLVTHFGKGFVDRLEVSLPLLSKELEDSGVGWKEFGNAMAEGDGSPNGDEAAPKTETAGVEVVAGAGESGQPPAVAIGEEKKPEEENETVKAFKSVIDMALTPVVDRLAAMEANITDLQELRKSVDERVAEAMTPRNNVTNITSRRPTDSDGNLLPADKAKDLDMPDAAAREGEGTSVAATRGLLESMLGGGVVTG